MVNMFCSACKQFSPYNKSGPVVSFSCPLCGAVNSTRNDSICAAYQTGLTLAAIGRQFGLSRPRIQQILKKAGVWVPSTKRRRTEYLGVTMTEQTKAALKVEAEKRGISLSALSDETLKEMLAVCGHRLPK
jgi:lambda repressor-like predicted transcriptional regulator